MCIFEVQPPLVESHHMWVQDESESEEDEEDDPTPKVRKKRAVSLGLGSVHESRLLCLNSRILDTFNLPESGVW